MKKHLFALTLVLFSFTFFAFIPKSKKNEYKYESTVILNIKKHTDEEIKMAHTLLLNNNTILIDYQCLVSGVIIFKISHNFTHDADVKNIVYNSLINKLSKSKINILFVDIHSKQSQC